MKILIAGGTGFIGKSLIPFLVKNGHEVNVLTRRNMNDVENIHYFRWDVDKRLIEPKAFDGVNALINMTGANIGEKRWTIDRKNEILNSRVKPLDFLLKAISEYGNRIDVLISSSAVGYYGAVTTNHIFTEEDYNGTDFPAYVCRLWEDEALKFREIADRVVILRKGLVIGKDGGVYQKLAPLAKLGLSVALGSGKQYFPLVYMNDLIRAYNYILEHHEIDGVFNIVGNQNMTMNEFSQKLLDSFGKRKLLPNIPAFIIKMLFMERAEMLLQGSKISNEKFRSTGFEFMY
ncbi:epimerase [Prevotella herbatica]|uniref:Epimerase n=1 Tax=Prevotella herbatica TaxID=2801997 RepID=A0ABM7NYX8_9BACT|nr:TIGR01777 family oxidoreductase [Prevotella herbatica]BCS85751.1 epimerase [Prevotella herbatica]